MNRIAAKSLALLITFSLSIIYPSLAIGQTQNTGAIQGRVFEAGTLAPLASAIVTVEHEEIGLERTTVSNDQGIYYVGILPAGRYRITASKAGDGNEAEPKHLVINNFFIHHRKKEQR